MSPRGMACRRRGSRGLVAAVALLLSVSGAIVGGCGGTGAAGVAEQGAGSPTIALEPVATIGCADCAGPELITPMGVALLPGERIVVLDRYEPYIRVFTFDGEIVRAFGAQGQGPGELGGASPRIPAAWVLSYPGVGPAVIGVFPTALMIYRTDGAFVRQEPLDLRGAVPVAQAFNRQAMVYFRLGFDVTAGGDDAIERCELEPPSEAHCERLALPSEFISVPDNPRAPNAGLDTLELAAALNGDLVVADTKLYRMWRLHGNGDILWRQQHEAPRAPKTDAELERDRANAAAFGLSTQDVDPLRDHIEREGMHFDGEGRLWVLTRRHQGLESVFDVFDGDGNPLAEISLAAAIRRVAHTIAPLVIDEDQMVAIVQHAGGNETIAIYRIVSH